MKGSGTIAAVALAIGLLGMGCSSDDEIDSDADARRAYLGIDPAMDRAISLGFDGFNAASSANIPEQVGAGIVSGTMTINGQVDQGASANKGMRLQSVFLEYSDGPVTDTETEDVVDIVYDTAQDQPIAIEMSLKGIPDGTFTGSVVGTLVMTGDIDATADFSLTLSGNLQDSGGLVIRAPGSMQILGTVVSGDGSYDVDVTR